MYSPAYNQSAFTDAITDYFYLLNRGYPEKGSLKIVGDRYCLSGDMRIVLYRGIAAKEKIISRQERITDTIIGKEIHIDGYNVLFTLLNYKLGRLVFISSDNICRDAGSLFGKIRKQKDFITTLIQLVNYLALVKPSYVRIFFDSPVSFSQDHRLMADNLLFDKGLDGDVQVVRSADYELKQVTNGIICTSDSAIIDQTKNPVADLSFHLIHHYYKPELLNLSNLLAGK